MTETRRKSGWMGWRRLWVILYVVGVGLATLGLLPWATATHGGFSPNVRVNAVTALDQRNASMAVGPGGTIHVVWEDYQVSAPRVSAIYYAKSVNGGASFTVGIPIVNPLPATAWQRSPSVAVSGNGHIHVAWTDLTTAGPPTGVFYARSENGGATFVDVKKVSDGVMGQSGMFVHPRIAYDGSAGCRLHVVWAVDEAASVLDPVFLTHDESPDCGVTFGADVLVDPGGFDASLDVASDGTLGVAYASGDPVNITFRMRIGGVWQNGVRVNDAHGKDNRDPTVAFDPSAPPGTRTVHVAWADGRNIDPKQRANTVELGRVLCEGT